MQDKDAIITELTRQVEWLMKRVEQLEDEIARLKKDSNNSSKPPSSDIVKPRKNRPKTAPRKRKRGGQPGHTKHTRRLFDAHEVDEAFTYELPAQDAVGLIALDQWHIVQQVTLPKKLYVVTEHRARKYFDPNTGRIIIAPLPDDVRKGGLLGADTTALAAFMKGGCHM